jgi:hypothetical protein
VRLKPDVIFEKGELTKLVKGLCKNVEFPIIVSEHGLETRVDPDVPDHWCFDIPDQVTGQGRLSLTKHSFDDDTVAGDLFVLVRTLPDGSEDWTQRRWYKYEYSKSPNAVVYPLPSSAVCFHGLSVDGFVGAWRGNLITWMDFRGPEHRLNLSRESVVLRPEVIEKMPQEVLSHWENIVKQHLLDRSNAHGGLRWEYLQAMIDEFPLQNTFWDDVEGTIPVYEYGKLSPRSFTQTSLIPKITWIFEGRFHSAFGGSQYNRTPLSTKPAELVD